METENFYIPIDNYKIKQNARDAIRGRLWQYWQLILVYMLIEVALSWILQFFLGDKVDALNEILAGTAENIPKEINFWPYYVYYGLNIVFSLLLIPISYGIIRNFSLYARGVDNDKWKTLFEKFTSAKDFFKTIGLAIVKYILLCLLSLLLVVPGIIMSLAWSFSTFLLYDEPELSIWNTLKKSATMMQGYKGKLFLLWLSFLGWIIVGTFTLGILYIWLYPYMIMSFAMFYDEVRRSYYNDDPAYHHEDGDNILEQVESDHPSEADHID